MSATVSKPAGIVTTLVTVAWSIVGIFQQIPYWLIALTARVTLAQVFWSSAQSHLANWDTTMYLFAESFKVPLLPPDLAAYMAVALELAAPPLLILGLATRFVALALFGMTMVIEIFVFPEAWPTHIQWAAMQLMLMGSGGGYLAIDTGVAQWFKRPE